MRWVVLAMACLSCVSREPCGPSNCTGCCSPLRDNCVENDPHVCSPPGAACAECDALSVCSAGQCMSLPRFDGAMSVDFGNVVLGNTGTETLTFTNVGGLPLVIRDAGVFPVFMVTSFAVTAGAAQTVMPHQAGTVTLTFTPPSLGGFGGNLVFDSNVDAGVLYAPLVTGSGIN